MIAHLPRKLYGSAVVALGLRGQRRVPYLPTDQLEALRDRRIRRMVDYAARHVPYYREMFARTGVHPGSIRRAADLDRLPLLDKELVRAEPSLFVAETAAGRTSMSFLTSGSTGRPMSVRHDRRSLLLNLPYGERERRPVIAHCGAFRPKELYVGYETAVIRDLAVFYRESVLMPTSRRRFVSVREPIKTIAALVDGERPDVLTGYGGWIHLFFQTLAARKMEIRLPKMVMYMGEALPPGGRELIKERFGIPVFSRYGAVESFRIGFYCEERSGFHVHEDLCHLRVVDEDDHAVLPGELGRIVLTNLVNRATVLINYPIGDMGVISPTACDCGRSLKVLSELDGRVEDLLPLADGRVVHPRAVWEIFKRYPEVLQYQLTQHETRRFEMSLVTVDEATYHHVVEKVRPGLANLLGPDAVIEAHRRTGLDRGPERKLRVVASLRGR